MVFTLAIVFASSSQARLARHVDAGCSSGRSSASPSRSRSLRDLQARPTGSTCGRFFQVLGVVLMVFAAGLLADAVENLQRWAGSRSASHVLWNTSRLVARGLEPRRRLPLAPRLRRPPHGAAGVGLGRLPRGQPDGVRPPLAQRSREPRTRRRGPRRCGIGVPYDVFDRHRLSVGKRGAAASGASVLRKPNAGWPVARGDRAARTCRSAASTSVIQSDSVTVLAAARVDRDVTSVSSPCRCGGW